MKKVLRQGGTPTRRYPDSGASEVAREGGWGGPFLVGEARTQSVLRPVSPAQMAPNRRVPVLRTLFLWATLSSAGPCLVGHIPFPSMGPYMGSFCLRGDNRLMPWRALLGRPLPDGPLPDWPLPSGPLRSSLAYPATCLEGQLLEGPCLAGHSPRGSLLRGPFGGHLLGATHMARTAGLSGLLESPNEPFSAYAS